MCWRVGWKKFRIWWSILIWISILVSWWFMMGWWRRVLSWGWRGRRVCLCIGLILRGFCSIMILGCSGIWLMWGLLRLLVICSSLLGLSLGGSWRLWGWRCGMRCFIGMMRVVIRGVEVFCFVYKVGYEIVRLEIYEIYVWDSL